MSDYYKNYQACKERKKEVKKVFSTVGGEVLNEDDYWAFVEEVEWPNKGYNDPKLKYLETVNPEVGKKLRKITNALAGVLDRFVGDRNPAQGGDDSNSDLLYHIIGLGKEAFYAHLKDYKLMEARGDAPYDSPEGYKESFSYCIPYENEWDDPEKAIEELKDSIERARVAEMKSNSDNLFGFQDLIDNITEALSEADGNYVAGVYNDICSDEVEYVEDSMWKIVEKSS
jgi:hypothetical protein